MGNPFDAPLIPEKRPIHPADAPLLVMSQEQLTRFTTRFDRDLKEMQRLGLSFQEFYRRRRQQENM